MRENRTAGTGWKSWVGALTLVVGALTAGVIYSVKGRSSQLFGRSVYRGSKARRSLALTFDDGPSPGTLDLLRYLDEQQIRATFFQCGQNVERYPDIARSVAAAGHEIGNHTDTHARLAPRLGWKLNLLSRATIHAEFARAQEKIVKATGVAPRWLRAPYGMRWFGLRSVQREMNLTGVMWTVIGHDWEWTANQVVTLVLRKSRPGGIICLHDGRDVKPAPDIGVTLAAVQQIVPSLKRHGYVFETVSEMIQLT